MVDPVTPNLGLAIPTRGSDTGTWDVPVNGDFTIIDSALGGITTIALTSASVTLATSQALNSIIRLTGTLAANVSITLPSVYKFWTIDNQLVNSPSSFAATLVSTSGTSVIGLPPSIQDVFYDGTSVRYKNLGNVGEYWDYAAATVPTWVTASTVPPYLVCNGTTFSSAVYPVLANLFGATTLPDARGKNRYTLNSGSSTITSTGAGIDGNTIFAVGGVNGVTAAGLPAHSHPNTLNDTGHSHSFPLHNATGFGGAPFAGAISDVGALTNGGTAAAFTGMTITNANSTSAVATMQNAAPGYVGGITMIRAA